MGQWLSHPPAYDVAAMKEHSHTGYGVWDITRKMARRVQQDWDAVESPPRSAELMGSDGKVIMFAPPPPPPTPQETRPLAA